MITTLETLPNEILIRILQELRIDGTRLHVSSHRHLNALTRTCRRLHTLAESLIYEVVLLRNVTQLAGFLDDTSGAWKQKPEAFRQVYIDAAYAEPEQYIRRPSGAAGYSDMLPLIESAVRLFAVPLDVLSINVHSVWVAEPRSSTFSSLLHLSAIKTRRLQHVLLDPPAQLRSVTSDPRATGEHWAQPIALQSGLTDVRLPFVSFIEEGNAGQLASAIAANGEMVRIRLDWPVDLDNDDVAAMLVTLGDALPRAGLVLAAPAVRERSSRLSDAAFSRDVARRFRLYCPDLSYAGIRARLQEMGTYEHLLDKLDYRIQDLPEDELAPVEEDVPEEPAMIASDGSWMDPSDGADEAESLGESLRLRTVIGALARLFGR